LHFATIKEFRSDPQPTNFGSDDPEKTYRDLRSLKGGLL